MGGKGCEPGDVVAGGGEGSWNKQVCKTWFTVSVQQVYN